MLQLMSYCYTNQNRIIQAALVALRPILSSSSLCAIYVMNIEKVSTHKLKKKV